MVLYYQYQITLVKINSKYVEFLNEAKRGVTVNAGLPSQPIANGPAVATHL
jgi:hypothetical protein